VGTEPQSYEFDVFVSHASEDKERFVEPLLAALRERGIRFWYDAEQIRLGDDFRRRMDEGLAKSRFGVIVLSPRFFKYWPEAELSALFAQEAAFDQTRILPIRCDLDRATLISRSPLLGARANVGWEMGVPVIADRIRDRVRSAPVGSRVVPSPLYNMPSRRARQLFGRATDLQQLDALLLPGRSVQVAASIEGLAGVGKTELALHIVNRLAEGGRFPGGIFWFDAEHPDLTTAWGSAVADALAVGGGTIQERAASALRMASTGAPILIILDNVEKWTRDSEPKPLPTGSHLALLVTTRNRSLGGYSFEHYTLEVLPREAAREFLSAVAGRDLTGSAGTEDLLRHLDGHSLAIELAGAYLREFPSVKPAAYLKLLEEGAAVEEKVKELVRYEATVRSALDVHLKHLDETARKALFVAACFAPEDASVALLEACGVDAEAQQPLRRFHLITGDGESWRMHRLVRDWARRIAPDDDFAQAKRRFVEGCADYSRAITLAEGARIYRTDGNHFELAAAEAEDVLGINNFHLTRLEHRLAIALISMGEFPRAKELLELALAFNLKHEDHSSVATIRSDLAMVFRELGDLTRAKELLELALDRNLTELGEDHVHVAINRSNLAGILKDSGDLRRAKELLELALASSLKNFGEDDSHVSTERSNLAIVLRKLGDLPRAKELHELALASGVRTLGEAHPYVATQRFNLAVVLLEKGDLSQAHTLLSQALSALERSLGDNHPSTAYARITRVKTLIRLGEIESARTEAMRALQAVANQPEDSKSRVIVERMAARILNLPAAPEPHPDDESGDTP
jgi:tetratricopeptide (TPR) repeat protein